MQWSGSANDVPWVLELETVPAMTDPFRDENAEIKQRRLISLWETYSRDTASDVDRRRLAAAWETPAWRKLQMTLEMSQAALDLARAGLRSRHPDAGEDEIRYRLACLLFGTQTADHLCPLQSQEETRYDI
jgi:hypothetical protein